MASLAAIVGVAPFSARASGVFRLGLTPVFLDNDIRVLNGLSASLSEATGFPIEFEQRRTYEEVTGLLLQGAVDAAWLCGFPYLQHIDTLSLLAVPVWRSRPLYQSYLIARDTDPADALEDVRGTVHAFSDPNSNSGYLMTVSDLIRMGETPGEFFRRSIFTYGHRNVVRAVADGLVRSGSVDGYVWEVLTTEEPELTRRTKVVSKSEWVGFPPFCARTDRLNELKIAEFKTALLNLDKLDSGRQALDLLQLDAMVDAGPELFEGIAARMRDLDALR